MIRVITPKGVLREAAKVFPVCEMRNKFNKRLVRTVESANNMSAEPTAVQIEFSEGTMPMMNMGSLFIGNLSTEAVKGIMQKLLEQEYFDFSSLEYQEERLLENTIFDAGVSKPYTSEYIPFGGVCVQGSGMFGAPQNHILDNDIFEGGCGGMSTECWDEESSEDCDDEE